MKASALTPAADGNGFTLAGEPHVLVTHDFLGTGLVGLAATSDEITITPDIAGDNVQLELTIAYHDDQQPYKGSRSYIARVEP